MLSEVRYPVQPPPPLYIFKGEEAFRPEHVQAESIVLPARAVRSVPTELWKPQFPVIVVTGPEYGFFAEADRDYLWKHWGVPAFEHLALSTGQIIAEECDAHDGLHLCQEATWKEGLLPGICPCGAKTPRIPGVASATDLCRFEDRPFQRSAAA